MAISFFEKLRRHHTKENNCRAFLVQFIDNFSCVPYIEQISSSTGTKYVQFSIGYTVSLLACLFESRPSCLLLYRAPSALLYNQPTAGFAQDSKSGVVVAGSVATIQFPLTSLSLGYSLHTSTHSDRVYIHKGP
ncbi:hypothetical protein RRG08_020937 [Elysia crispata]|uniref:Uncharacterized protein n=1 Tax=Elysia crispata TaxID=231223 RepID=A0AAE1A9T0_9GAST|nr:hypothetical protein RRG08_020937 [Elysia crispata]